MLTTESPFHYQLTWSRWVFLGVVAMALSSFLPLSIFAPVPLALAFLLYGRNKGLLLGAAGLSVLFVLVVFFKMTPVISGTFFVSTIYAVLLSEIFFRKLDPSKGLMQIGFLLVTGVFLILTLILLVSEFSILKWIETLVVDVVEKMKAENADFLSLGGEEAMILKSYIAKPETLAAEIVRWVPTMIFSSIFLTLWASLFILLRNGLHWRPFHTYPFGLQDLSRFKSPDAFVWILIGAMIILLGGEVVLGKSAEIVGLNVLYCLGVFYFFQGFGLYVDLLSHLKIFGLMRSLLILMTLITAWKFLVIVGIFDHWGDFRKYFRPKNSKKEGDLL